MFLLRGLAVLFCVFLICESSNDSFNFVVLGDWGGQETSPYYTKAEKEISEVMGAKAKEVDAQFVLALGDNFYSHGVTDVEDPRFKETFEVSKVTHSGIS